MTKKTDLSYAISSQNALFMSLSRLKQVFLQGRSRLLLLMGALILGGCSSNLLEPCSCSSPPLSELNGTWELTGWNLPPQNGQVRLRTIPHGDNGESLKMTFDQANQRLSGFSGCNRFTGSVKDDPKGIIIGNLASTRMMCAQERMSQLEQDFLYQLKDYRSFKIDKNQLLLIGRDGDVLGFTKR